MKNKAFARICIPILCLVIQLSSVVIVSANDMHRTGEIEISSVDFASSGDICKITVTSYDWDKISAMGGGYDIRIQLPSVLEVMSVFLNGRQISSDSDSGREYYLTKYNEIRFNNYFEGGAEDSFFQYSVIAKVKPGTAAGKYKISFLKKSVVIDENEQEIPMTFTNGVLVVSERDCLKGDLDNDGFVAGADLVLLRKKLLRLNDAPEDMLCDINSDGKTDICDLIALKKYIVNTYEHIYLSDNGNDGNAGGEEAPVKSLSRALELVSCNGTIEIIDKYTVEKDFCWNHHSKTVNITGGSIDFTPIGEVYIGDGVRFYDTELSFNYTEALFACGYPLTIGNNVTVNGKPQIYGGDNSRNVQKTDVTLLSGVYEVIFAGGANSDVTEKTNLYVGGNVNASVENITDHSQPYLIFGGCNVGSTKESNIVFTDNAATKMLYGGGNASSYVGKTNIQINGGKLMGIYGGSNIGTCGETNITMKGGEAEQIFGGNESNSMTGNTNINILGGKISRRIFGGCYNDADLKSIFDKDLTWYSSYHVTGTTTVTIGENANITLDYSGSMVDKGISATSRQKTAYEDEYAVIVFENSKAKEKYYSKLGIKAFAGSTWAKPYDNCYTKQ